MILVFQQGATEAQAASALRRLEAADLHARRVPGAGRILIHVLTKDVEPGRELLQLEGLERVLRSGPKGLQPAARAFYPYHFIGWCIAGLALLCALALLAAFLPPGLGLPVDLEQPPARIGPPWYFRGLDQFLGLFPAGLSWLATALALLFWIALLLLPRIDRSRPGSVASALVRGLGLAVVAAFVWLSLRGLAF